MPEPILTKDYTYDLPQDRIALQPLAQRDQSKLLVYKKGRISHQNFSQLVDLLPDKCRLFFNNTKVIQARFLFQKSTGATIEVFLLSPFPADTLLATALGVSGSATWLCTVGNLKRWTDGVMLEMDQAGIKLTAKLLDREQGLVQFDWQPNDLSFGEVIHRSGVMPLPPYIHRKSTAMDTERYQTVYSQVEGAVAAPTAGLHFTPTIMDQLRDSGRTIDFVALHVGAGTFKPIKTENALDHTMHAEQIVINRKNVENMAGGKQIVAVGTTSMRTLESLYWYAVALDEQPDAPFQVKSDFPYQHHRHLPGRSEAAYILLRAMRRRGTDTLTGSTSLYVHPGYSFRMCDALVTNFHQPGSTLLLLIAAFVGPDWKRVYQEALDHGYRFLSYGDSSLLMPI
ncbi:MAG TPA: S-adenosylmethionine:tRNA ribosyltransferase-isomerase [Cyclobacteriaceae bacterium]|nr:S-adenosylmethionine:tRNA ribosyltransferase-isomerase [Cyclobacteriaceae bacterium]HQQ98434.1 S-adenosylmethionine:tRNA ribosyltransferase-isomerase [Cyclobacteriaceae bacterium]